MKTASFGHGGHRDHCQGDRRRAVWPYDHAEESFQLIDVLFILSGLHHGLPDANTAACWAPHRREVAAIGRQQAFQVRRLVLQRQDFGFRSRQRPRLRCAHLQDYAARQDFGFTNGVEEADSGRELTDMDLWVLLELHHSRTRLGGRQLRHQPLLDQ